MFDTENKVGSRFSALAVMLHFSG